MDVKKKSGQLLGAQNFLYSSHHGTTFPTCNSVLKAYVKIPMQSIN